MSFYYTLTFPVEWLDFFENRQEIDENPDLNRYCHRFGYPEWRQWVANNPHWTYLNFDEEITTRHHDMEGYEGESLICHRMNFEVHTDAGRPFRRQPVRRELRISVPPPTKLPLPRDL